MKDKEYLITEMCDNMRVHGSIIIMGAGASYSVGMPLCGQLAPIVWNVVEANLDLKKELDIPLESSVKDYIGDDFNLAVKAYDAISHNDEAYNEFRKLFCDLNNEKNQINSIVHETICRMLHNGHITLVVSFNWDDLLESAWTKLYGTGINDCMTQLIKPHGCVRNVKEKWILPNSPGFISKDDKKIINRITQRPKILILVGYSESDEAIVNELIVPTDRVNKSYRIAPNAIGSIQMDASSAFEYIKLHYLKGLNNERYFEYIDYSNQVGIEPAILGHRLQPSNIKSCPELPVLDDAKTKLDFAHIVIIESEAGCGKSISAYQLAYKYIKFGYEVVKVNNDRVCDSLDLIFGNNDYKTIYIIDDAQQIDSRIIHKLFSYASLKRKFIITQTATYEFGEEKVRITKASAVKAINDYYVSNADEIIEIVKVVNKKVGRNIGNLYLDMSLDQVLSIAKKESTPWLYNYSLRGGWSNTMNQYNIASDYNESHLALVLISIRQILSLDKPVDYDWLVLKSETIKKNKTWVNDCIDYLNNERIILSSREVRTHHLQMAIRIIMKFIKDSNNEERELIVHFLEEEMLLEDTPLRGALWFFNMAFSFEAKYMLDWHLERNGFFDKLLVRIMSEKDTDEWVYSLYVLSDVIVRSDKKNLFDINNHYNDFLKYSVENVNEKTVYPLYELINHMINCDLKKKIEFVKRLDLEVVIRSVNNINNDYLYSCARFLNRLVYQQKPSWKKKWNKNFSYADLEMKLINSGPEKIGSAMEFVYTLLMLDSDKAFSIYEALLPNMKYALKKDLSETLGYLELDFLFLLCGQGLFSTGRPNKKQINATKQFVDLIDENSLVDLLQNGVERDWSRLYRFASIIFTHGREKFSNAILDVEFLKLEKTIEDCWGKQNSEFEMLIRILAQIRPKEVDELIYKNSDKLEFLDPTLTMFSPRTARELFYDGKKINLLSSKQTYWESSMNALMVLRRFDKKFAKDVAKISFEEVQKSFIKLDPTDWEKYHLFFDEIRKCSKEVASNVVISSYENSVIDRWYSNFNADNHKYNQGKKNVNGLYKLIGIIEKLDIDNEIISKFSAIREVKFENVSSNNR